MKTKIFLLTLFFQQVLFAQYSPRDYKLVQKTFFRDFSDSLYTQYLNSGDIKKINSALLSISHSKETNFIESIIQLDPRNHAKFMFFALGQLGYSKNSIDFLMSKITDDFYKEDLFELLTAIGKTGSDDELKLLLELNENKRVPLLSAAIMQFVMRGIKTNDESEIDYLISNLNNNDQEERFFSLYALYRFGGSEKAVNAFENLLSSQLTTDVLFTLANLRRMQIFPFSFSIAQKLITHSDWRIRVEAARILVNFDFSDEDEILQYLNLLNDSNPNVSRQAAQSISNISKIDSLIDLQKLLFERLESNTLTNNALGELAVSYADLYKNSIPNIFSLLESKLLSEYLFQVAAQHNDKEWKLDYFKNNFIKINSKNSYSYVNSLLSVQNEFENDERYSSLVINLISDDSPILNAMTVSLIDSTFIAHNSKILKDLLTKKIIQNKDNAAFSEAVPIFAETFEKISATDSKLIYELLLNSSVTSVAKFASAKLETKQRIIAPTKESINKFDEFFSNAFAYRSAIIITNKGEFEIQFLAEFAPVTVGNFIYLAKRGFYNGVSFHRVVPNFVIQTGDRTGTGWGGPGYEIKSEFSFLPFDEGYVGMASSGMDTEGSQWFVMHSYAPHLNGNYTNFAKVVNGMETVNKIDLNDNIIEIRLID